MKRLIHVSGKTRRNRDRRHRRMDEARSEESRLLRQIRETTDEEEKARLYEKLRDVMARSTRKANKL